MRLLFSLTGMTCLIATSSIADAFDRPIPQAQSATAELWFGLASIAMIAALVLVHKLVARS